MGDPAELERLIGDLVRVGVVAEVDLATARCAVRLDDEFVTEPLKWFAVRAGKTRRWSPPSVGEQVVLLCPEGDVEGAFVLLGLYSDDFPAPSSDDVELIHFEDGAAIAYDPAAHALSAVLPAGGTVDLVAPGGVTVLGDVTMTGKLTVQGEVEASGLVKSATDVKAGDISLKTHKHGQVAAGTAKTGAPE